MKNKILQLHNLLFVGGIFAISFILIAISLFVFKSHADEKGENVAIRSVSSDILADGTVTAQNQATLHFQAGGKLASLNVKEGDTVYQGQTIASLDTYALQRQLTEALNTYKTTRNTFDQNKQNNQNTVSINEQQAALRAAGAGNAENLTQTTAYGTNTSTTNYIDQIVQRVADNSQAGLDNSVANVEIANYAIQLSSLNSPINGVVTHLDVTSAGVNVTSTTSFVIQDPSSLVFRAYVSENDIDYVSVGANVKIKIGNGKEIAGTVQKVSPDKVTLPSGSSAYQVDVTSPDIQSQTKIGENGSVIITSNTQTQAKLVPTWTVLNNDSIWVMENGKAVLKHVTVGKTHGDKEEITGGLSDLDEVILNPESVAAGKYQLL